MRRFHLLFLTLLLLGVFAYADEASGEAAEEEEEEREESEEQEESEEEPEEEEEEAVEEYDYEEEEEVYENSFEVCSDSAIVIDELSLYCDSPGTYYYGSNKYRDSESCMSGDKAKLDIIFEIVDEDEIYDAGGYALITIEAQGYGAIDDQMIYQNAEICSLSTLQSLCGTSCPEAGQYQISTQFYWGEQDKSLNYSFVPGVMIGIKSDLENNNYDLGGANTNKCSGNTFTNWTEGIRKTYANALSNFMKSFGILVLTIGIMGAFLYYLVKRQRAAANVVDGVKESFLMRGGGGDKKESLLIDEDFRKIQMVGGNRNIVDF